MEKSFSLKDELFNKETVTELGNTIKSVYPLFDLVLYVEQCLNGFVSRELKQRMSHMTTCLKSQLPSDFYEATDILLKACEATETKENFVYGSFSEYVEKYGCSKEYLSHSLSMLGEYTKVFSAEFAIRAFISKYPEETFRQMLKWAQSEHVDHRRLASEGLRHKLPWGSKIDFDPIRAIEVLEYLYYDRERYVTRSVANHLNDLSKFQPNLVISTLKRWEESGNQEGDEMAYIINHSTRTLIKKGHIGALALQGYIPNPKIEVFEFQIQTPKITVGENMIFGFEIRANEDVKLMIDYLVDYPMANGKRSTKVFKIKRAQMRKNDHLKISKKHLFREMTTKKLYSGEYKVTLQINGKLYSEGSFNIEV